ncbi:MAG: glutathione S-transferase N-terminal domain-containing protein [Myxococcales bacterium]|nr:glutathione S-transferase N-terminal domain-containing protein [Myxococcales bacterium]MCB9732839.1 glutathione S-transferase N-terminal domain-containing protein [Deltaproteobacteria bacterium]
MPSLFTPPRTLNDASSLLASVLRGGRGLIACPRSAPDPSPPLVLYEFEACPYCRKVRETLSELDLSYVSRPSAAGSARRVELEALGGRVRVPYLIDEAAGVALYESEDIIDHLRRTYGRPRPRALRALGAPLNTATAAAASAARPRGRKVTVGPDAPRPSEPLVLWSFEASPYCRKVREVLCELDLEARIENVAKRSARRPELIARGGKMQVPYLEDPGRGVAMYESDDIVRYLRETYGG